MASKVEKLMEELEHRTPLADNPIIAGDNIAEVFEQMDHEVEVVRELFSEILNRSKPTT